MYRAGLLAILRWAAIVLFIASFIAPLGDIAHAAEMEMGHEMMEMECEDGDCEDTSSQQDCLEHCLQTSTSDGVLFIVAPSQNDTQSDIIHEHVFEKPARKAAKTIAQTTGPPHSTERHLTTQKRE